MYFLTTVGDESAMAARYARRESKDGKVQQLEAKVLERTGFNLMAEGSGGKKTVLDEWKEREVQN